MVSHRLRIPFLVLWLFGGGIALAAGAWAAFADDDAQAELSAAELDGAVREAVKEVEPTIGAGQMGKLAAKKVRRKATLIAVLANVAASSHRGQLSWGGQALAIRDAAVQLEAAARKSDSARAVQALKRIQELLDDSGGSKGVDGQPWPQPLEHLSLERVMEEMRALTAPLRRKLRRASTFAAHQEAIGRDAKLVALLASVARTDTHPARKMKRPEEQYEAFCDQTARVAARLAAAIRAGQRETANALSKQLRASCSQCHHVFRPEEEH